MKVIQIQGATFWEAIETVRQTEKNVVVYFYGDRKENGESWCPDCVNGTYLWYNVEKKYFHLMRTMS